MDHSTRPDRYQNDDNFVIERLAGGLIGVQTFVFCWFVFFAVLSGTILTSSSGIVGRYSPFLSSLSVGGPISMLLFIIGTVPFLTLAYLGAAQGLSMSVVTATGTLPLTNAPLLDGFLAFTPAAIMVVGGSLAAMATEGRPVTIPVVSAVTCTIGYVVTAISVTVVGTIFYELLVAVGIVSQRVVVGVPLVRILGFTYPSLTTMVVTLILTALPFITVGAVIGTVYDTVIGEN